MAVEFVCVSVDREGVCVFWVCVCVWGGVIVNLLQEINRMDQCHVLA